MKYGSHIEPGKKGEHVERGSLLTQGQGPMRSLRKNGCGIPSPAPPGTWGLNATQGSPNQSNRDGKRSPPASGGGNQWGFSRPGILTTPRNRALRKLEHQLGSHSPGTRLVRPSCHTWVLLRELLATPSSDFKGPSIFWRRPRVNYDLERGLSPLPPSHSWHPSPSLLSCWACPVLLGWQWGEGATQSWDFRLCLLGNQMGKCWAVWLHCEEANPSCLRVQPPLPREEVPTDLLQTCRHHPQQETVWISPAKSQIPPKSSVGGRGSGSEWEHSKCETLRGYSLGPGPRAQPLPVG